MTLTGLVEGTLQQDILDVSRSHYIPQVQIIFREPNTGDRKKAQEMRYSVDWKWNG